MKLIGISGSLRVGSHNSALLRTAADMMPQGVELAIASINGIPLYDGDLEAGDGVPRAVNDLKDAIADADGLLLATPEYNHSMPGVFKNAIDWLSRPPEDIERVFAGKPVALMGVTLGGFGTVLGQAAWSPVLRRLDVDFWSGGSLFVSGGTSVFDSDGRLSDGRVEDELRAFLKGFVAFAKRSPRAKPGVVARAHVPAVRFQKRMQFPFV